MVVRDSFVRLVASPVVNEVYVIGVLDKSGLIAEYEGLGSSITCGELSLGDGWVLEDYRSENVIVYGR